MNKNQAIVGAENLLTTALYHSRVNSDDETALSLLQSAHASLKRSGNDNDSTSMKLRGVILTSIGYIFEKKKDYDKALQYYGKAMDLYRCMGLDDKEESRVLSTRSGIERVTGQVIQH